MKKCFSVVAVFAMVFLAAQSRAAPNLTGVWKLNLAKSELGPVPQPEVLTRTVNHNDPSLQISSYTKGAAGETTTELKYTTDGKPAENKGSKGSAKWDGDKLVVDSVRDFQGSELKLHDVWTLSPDGKTLTVSSHLAVPQGGEFDITWVFDKQ
jgi:hypothetical protein